jgi:protein-tyrosine phosphatase
MAEALLQARVIDEAQDWKIGSAGTQALSGYSAAYNSRLVMEKRGLYLSEHLARQITREMIAGYNLVLTMERGQKEALVAAFPEFAPRVLMLSELDGELQDVVDPIGGPLRDFEDTANEIDKILSRGFQTIRRLSADIPDRSAP